MSAGSDLETAVATDAPLGASERISAASLLALAVIALLFAIALRLPYLSESFWVDELHSAWTIWSGLGEVAPRAALGNQTPVYYWGLWFWRQAAGDGETALRMSSVLLSSLACGGVAAGVARFSRSLSAGALAGAALALEPNAIFFGTELRVFAAVMLLAVVALSAWSAQRTSGSEAATAALFAAVLAAAVIQPISLGVLGWLCLSRTSVAALWRWFGRPLAGHHRRFISVALLIAGIGLWLLWSLAGRVLLSAWQHRDQWAAFAAAHSPMQVWNLWRWDLLLLIPLALAGTAALVDRFARAASTRCRSGPRWLPLVVIAVAATALYWVVSAVGMAAIFHRRFLIAALPITVWAGGMALGDFFQQLRNRLLNHFCAAPMSGKALASGDHGKALAFMSGKALAAGVTLSGARASAVLLAGFALAAILFVLFRGGESAATLRGENWRAAAAYVAARPSSRGPVLLSPGLIETGRMLASGDPVQVDYLSYPLSGPYSLPSVEVISLGESPRRLHDSILENRSRFVVLRLPHRLAQRWAERVVLAGDAASPLAFSTQNFGGVQVIEFFNTAAADTADAGALVPR